MNRIEITPMNESNVSAVAQVASENLPEAWSLETYRNQLSNPNDFTFLACLDGEPAGFISVWYVLDEAEINNVAVSEKFRRKGIASALFAAVEKALPNAQRWVLEVRESNEKAISLYKKLGFENAGIRKNFYSKPMENAIIMVKRHGEEV